MSLEKSAAITVNLVRVASVVLDPSDGNGCCCAEGHSLRIKYVPMHFGSGRSRQIPEHNCERTNCKGLEPEDGKKMDKYGYRQLKTRFNIIARVLQFPLLTHTNGLQGKRSSTLL